MCRVVVVILFANRANRIRGVRIRTKYRHTFFGLERSHGAEISRRGSAAACLESCAAAVLPVN